MSKYDPPTPDKKDRAHLAARVAISAVPAVGSPALELFNAVVTPPLEKRRQEWMESIGEGLRQLEEQRAVDVSKLPDLDTFVDAAVQATIAALRTSEQREEGCIGSGSAQLRTAR